MHTLPLGRGLGFRAVLGSKSQLGIAVFAFLLFLGDASAAAWKDEWEPVTKDELTEEAPKIQPDAAAEVLFMKQDVDDSAFPDVRIRRDYIRAKIYKPEQIEWLTRVSGREIYDENRNVKVTLSARLTLPDGSVKNFGDESIRERTLSQTGERNFLERLLGSSGNQVKERFLAVSGVEKGAVLEIKTEFRTENHNAIVSIGTLQRRNLAIRKLEVTTHAPDKSEWTYRYFVLNPAVGQSKMDENAKRRTLTVVATDVPPMPDEPMAGLSPAYSALCLVASYEKRDRTTTSRHKTGSIHIDPTKTGQWSVVSITNNWIIDDYVEHTSRIRKLVTDVTAGANDPLEKAKRIHTQVCGLYANFVRESRFNKTQPAAETFSTSLDNAVDYTRKTPYFNISRYDYLALAVSMYQVAGLEARVILLPDRRQLPFSRSFVTRALVPIAAVSVKINDQWMLSTPTTLPSLSFGQIPWYCEGQLGLIVKDGPEEFIQVPYSDSSKALIGNGGSFTITPDGSLEGTGRRKYSGHAAYGLRERLLNRDLPNQRSILARQISRDFKIALKRRPNVSDEGADENSAEDSGAITITHFSGLDSIDAPLEVDYKIKIPNYAVVTDQRIIFRPWLFRVNASNPFASETRKTNVVFPYALQELDVLSIKLPSGYKPEFPEVAPPSSGHALHFKSTANFDPETSTLKLRREYATNLVVVPINTYPALKEWFDKMTAVDQQEVIATRDSTNSTPAAPAAPEPAKSESNGSATTPPASPSPSA